MECLRAVVALQALVITGYASPVFAQGASSNVVVALADDTTLAIPGQQLELNVTGGLQSRVDEAGFDDEFVRRFERKGRELLTDFMLGTVQQCDHLLTHANGGPDPWNNNWQRATRDTLQELASDKTLGRAVLRAWKYQAPPSNRNPLDGLQNVFGCFVVRQQNAARPEFKQRPVPGTMYPHGPDLQVVMQQTEGYRDKGRNKQPASNAVYDAVFNVADGVIVVKNNMNPCQAAIITAEEEPRKDLRKYREHSRIEVPVTIPRGRQTVTWAIYQAYSWTAATTVDEMEGFMNYIIIDSIETADTNSIIIHYNEATRLNGQYQANVVFPAGHWCFYALLATPESQHIVQFLVQHKAADSLGHKVLFSVQIVWNTATNKAGLQWTIANMDPVITNMLAAEEARWLPPQLQNRHFQGPTGNVAAGSGPGPATQAQDPGASQLAPNWRPARLAQRYGYLN